MNDEQVKHMVNRFLGWRLPDNFSPDAGISFKPTFNDHMPFGPQKHNPTGTNLFGAKQAESMVRYLLEGLPDYDALRAEKNALLRVEAAAVLKIESLEADLAACRAERDQWKEWHASMQAMRDKYSKQSEALIAELAEAKAELEEVTKSRDTWAAQVGVGVDSQVREGKEYEHRLRKIYAHTVHQPNCDRELLVGLLASIARICKERG